uniref:Cholinergic receptor, nicotinic, alpha 10a n=1 Tax=Salmo trutta TaxID=8032 RepID=A0A673XMQ0_SALTR
CPSVLHHLDCSLCPVLACWCPHGKYAQKLLNDLFTNYTSALRPVEETENLLNVTLQITLSQIIDMDERNQIKDDYDGLDTIRIPSSYVWRPDIVLYNNADSHFTGSMDTNVVIRYDGQIIWDSPVITKSSCKVDVSFPFDVQQCRFTYSSWTYNGNQMDLQNAMDHADLADLVENVEWEVLGMPAKRNIILYGCCAEPYPDLTYTLQLKRKASFYVFNLLIPCVMISFLAPLGFYLPADSGEKVSLGVTVMLALTVFQLLVAETMPPSENVPLIGKYYMTMITASTALTIFITNIHHCGPDAKPVPKWAKIFILQYVARVCFVYEVGENCMYFQPEKPDPPPQPTPQSRNGGVGGSTGREEVCKTQCTCQHQQLLRNIEYIANCYRDTRATAKRTGEWKKVAKVLDRFFMWIFFIMVFSMSLLITGKAL